MRSLAVRAAQTSGYTNAGTVEFLFDGKEFYLLEVNTRIQVEHCVSEAVSSIDLVAEQLRIASGEPLSVHAGPGRAARRARSRRACTPRTWRATSCRHRARSPPRASRAGPWVREDRGFEAGHEITPFYDGMIAKLIVWGPTREIAIARTLRALAEYSFEGIKTNLTLLKWLLAVLRLPQSRPPHELHRAGVQEPGQ